MSAMSGPLPSECVLDRRRVRTGRDGGKEDLVSQQPFLVLSCVDKQAVGFNEEDEADEVVQSLDLVVHLAVSPPDLSCLALRGGSPFTSIETIDKNVVILTSTFPGDRHRHLYLVYDAIDESLRMIPLLRAPSRISLTSRILVARPRHDDDYSYALALTGKLQVASQEDGHVQWRDSLFLWRPSSAAPPWSEIRKASFPDKSLADERVYQADVAFSCNGRCYWADLLCGVMHCSCDSLFDGGGDGDPVAEFGFIHLPVEPAGHHRDNRWVARPDAYRTMGAIGRGSSPTTTIRFVSIDGFLEHVDLEDRTVTVWRLLDHDMGWEKEHELSLKALWGLEGFYDLPKKMTPMFPLLSMEDEDVVYLALGEYRESERYGRFKFLPNNAQYLLAVDMRRGMLLSSARLPPDQFGRLDIPDLVSSDFSRYLRRPTHTADGEMIRDAYSADSE